MVHEHNEETLPPHRASNDAASGGRTYWIYNQQQKLTVMTLKEQLQKIGACETAIEWVGDKTLEQAWAECHRGDWMLWLYRRSKNYKLQTLTLAKGHCANTVRHLMKDKRSIDAVDMAIRFGEGNATSEELCAAASAADAAYAAYTYAYAYASKENRLAIANICRQYLPVPQL